MTKDPDWHAFADNNRFPTCTKAGNNRPVMFHNPETWSAFID